MANETSNFRDVEQAADIERGSVTSFDPESGKFKRKVTKRAGRFGGEFTAERPGVLTFEQQEAMRRQQTGREVMGREAGLLGQISGLESPFSEANVEARLAALRQGVGKQREQALTRTERDLQKRGLLTSTLGEETRQRIEEGAMSALTAGEAQIREESARAQAQFQLNRQQLYMNALNAMADRGITREQIELERERAKQEGDISLFESLGDLLEIDAEFNLGPVKIDLSPDIDTSAGGK